MLRFVKLQKAKAPEELRSESKPHGNVRFCFIRTPFSRLRYALSSDSSLHFVYALIGRIKMFRMTTQIKTILSPNYLIKSELFPPLRRFPSLYKKRYSSGIA